MQLTLFLLLLQYHTGYQQQMSNWPELPVNSMINWLSSRSSSLVVADFGCGEILIWSYIYICCWNCFFFSPAWWLYKNVCFSFQVMRGLQRVWRTKFSPLILSQRTLLWLPAICQMYTFKILLHSFYSQILLHPDFLNWLLWLFVLVDFTRVFISRCCCILSFIDGNKLLKLHQRGM